MQPLLQGSSEEMAASVDMRGVDTRGRDHHDGEEEGAARGLGEDGQDISVVVRDQELQEMPSDALSNMTTAIRSNARYTCSDYPSALVGGGSVIGDGGGEDDNVLGLGDAAETAEAGSDGGEGGWDEGGRGLGGAGMEGAPGGEEREEQPRGGAAAGGQQQFAGAEGAGGAGAEGGVLAEGEGGGGESVGAEAGGARTGQKARKVKEKIGGFDAVCVGARFYLREGWQDVLTPGRRLKLVRDHNNTHDANAVCVQLPESGAVVGGLHGGRANESKAGDLAADARTLGYLPKGVCVCVCLCLCVCVSVFARTLRYLPAVFLACICRDRTS